MLRAFEQLGAFFLKFFASGVDKVQNGFLKVAMCVFEIARVLRLVVIPSRSVLISSLLSITIPTSLHAQLQCAKKAYAILITKGGDAMMSLKSLSDQELTGRLRQLVRKEQNLTLAILHTRIIL